MLKIFSITLEKPSRVASRIKVIFALSIFSHSLYICLSFSLSGASINPSMQASLNDQKDLNNQQDVLFTKKKHCAKSRLYDSDIQRLVARQIIRKKERTKIKRVH
jgi:hypothetical protein